MVTGCSGDTSPYYELINVTGTVSLEGEPLQNVEVLFSSPSGAQSFGVTDEKGRYQLEAPEYGSGVPVGEYLVYISGNKTTAIAATGKTVAIAEKYSDSVISKVIIPADNSTGENPLTFDFVLKHNPSESDLFTTTEEP
tara:strand:- start:3055 stop:3471 length:417 start_codon:yes stop_codon:yes gene_type:complete